MKLPRRQFLHLADFIAYAKANPGKINMASAGNGTPPHVFGELFKMMAGVDLVHVPYRSNYMPDLLGGQVQVSFSSVPASIELIRTGKLRVLAVTPPKRERTHAVQQNTGATPFPWNHRRDRLG
jgi:tripartite-type tricarboxylate transporter receptor subunit TctC